MKKLLTSLTCLALVCLAHAQQTDHPGYIVRTAGDTLHGYLKQIFSGDLIGSVGFKARATDNDFTMYSPAQVTAFQFDEGNAYRAITFAHPLRENARQTTFARLLVGGEYELYSFIDKSTLYFLVKQDTLVHLMYDDDLHVQPYVDGNWKNELNFFSVGCETARGYIERSSFGEQSMMRFFRQLDNCLAPGKATTTYFHKPNAHFGFFAYAGGMVLGDSKSQFTGEARARLTYPQLKANISFNIGVRYARVVRQMVDQNYLVATVYHKTTYGMTSIPFTVQYNLTRGIIQPYIFAGLALLRNSITTDDPYQPYVVDDTYYKRWSMSGAVGGGVEVSITDFLQARAEWRYEDFAQYPTVGLSVRF